MENEEIKDLGFVEYDTSKETAVEALSRKCGPIETIYHHTDKFSLKKWKDTEEYQNYYSLSYTCEIIHPITSEKKLRGFEYNGVSRNKSELVKQLNNLKRTS